MSHKDFIRLCLKQDQEGALALLDQHSDWLDKELEWMYYLNSNGRDVHAGSTAIIAAAVGGSMGLIRALLKRGADVRKVYGDGWNALMMASRYGHLGAATLLLDRAPDLVESRNNEHQTPLHLAAFNDRVEIWQLLIARGADLRVTDDNGDTPLNVYGNDTTKTLTHIVKQQHLDQLQAAFADGSNPSQVCACNLFSQTRPWPLAVDNPCHSPLLLSLPLIFPQVQRRRDERWARRWSFMSVLVGCGFCPLAARRLQLEMDRLALGSDMPPPEPLDTPQQRHAHLLGQVLSNAGLVRSIASYL
jgi:hypothetical protein